MRCAGANDDHIGWIERAARPVGMNDGDLWPGFESGASAIREGRVDFDGDDAATRADKLAENGCVIAGATTKMNDVIAGMNVEQAQMKCPKAGLTIVQTLGRVENDKRILVHVARVGTFNEGLFAARLDHPWAGADKAFAGNGGECGTNARRGDAICPA